MTIHAVLGPQRPAPNIRPLLGRLGDRGLSPCAVTAGWQEREGELDDLADHAGCPIQDLALYARADDVFARDRELHDAYRQRQETLMEMQRLYRRRLHHAMAAMVDLLVDERDSPVLDKERQAALRAVRTLDRQHLRRIRAVHDQFENTWRPTSRPSVSVHRGELSALLEASGVLLLAGGHVEILLNRLRLFDLLALAPDLAILAWSAGAMALSDRIILFHDHPPHGAGYAEAGDIGLGLIPDVVLLPHASRRLRLDDPDRVSLFARRFAPARALTLDPGACLVRDNCRLTETDSVRRLMRNGTLVTVKVR